MHSALASAAATAHCSLGSTLTLLHISSCWCSHEYDAIKSASYGALASLITVVVKVRPAS